MKLASFDIFDTTLIRKCGLPENIFYLLAYRLYPEDIALREEFLLWRQTAEVNAQKRNQGKEVTLDDIYLNKVGKDKELEIESENLIANPEIKSLITKKRLEGYTICFISDMYINAEFLADILRREGCLLEEEQVFVSCEFNARKSSGKLFDVVRSKMRPSVWEHWGDHRISDVKIPKKKGIGATLVKSDFTEVERQQLNYCKELQSNYELSILVGLERAARLIYENTTYAEIAADFIAPSYIPYVSFVLNDAWQRGLRRLYFLSRDSYILMKLAETQKDFYPDIELRYLFVSRKSLLLPFLKDVDVASYLSVQDHCTILRKDVDELLTSLTTNRREMEQEYGIVFGYSKIYGKKEEQDFLEKIFNTKSPFAPILRKRITEQRILLLDYFRQEGLLDNGQYGMVDVGWLGTSRLMINDILQTVSAKPVEFYYYGIRKDVFPTCYGRYTSYYRSCQLSTEITALVENYFSASPYPSTKSYVRGTEGIVPQFVDGKLYQETDITATNCKVTQWIWKEMLDMKLAFDVVFWAWGKISLNAITSLSVNIDLTAFSHSAGFDKLDFMRKLTFQEICRMVLLGEHITAFDRGSLQWSCGRSIYSLLWRIHEYSGRIRRKLYLKFIK